MSEVKSPLSSPNGREASVMAVIKNPLSDQLISHCREVSLTAVKQCYINDENKYESMFNADYSTNSKNKNKTKIEKIPYIGITKTIKKK